MDYNQWPQIHQQQNPNPNPQLPAQPYPNSTVPYPSYSCYPRYNYDYSHQLQNPNPNNPQSAYYTSVPVDSTNPNPPGVDPYPYPQPHYNGEGYLGHQLPGGGVSYEHYSVQSSVAVTYYPDPNAGAMVHTWAGNEAVALYPSNVLHTNGAQQFVPATPSAAPSSVSWTNPNTRSKGASKRGPKTKVVQSAWCEVCNVCCDTKDVLDLHKSGKKHKKNLMKLKEASLVAAIPIVSAEMPAPVPFVSAELPTPVPIVSVGMPAPLPVVSAGLGTLVIGPSENPAYNKGKKAAGTAKDSQKKVVQFLWCEVCRVGCDTKEVLEVHKSGKKHKKNMVLHNGAGVIVPTTVALTGSQNSVIGPLNNPVKKGFVNRSKSKKKAAETLEDLETKRRKVMEGGASVGSLRTCSICNVVCNSEIVFKYHLTGQKHIALVKKLAPETTNIPTAT